MSAHITLIATKEPKSFTIDKGLPETICGHSFAAAHNDKEEFLLDLHDMQWYKITTRRPIRRNIKK